MDVIVSIADYVSHVVPVTRSNTDVPTSFSQYCTKPLALIFHVFPGEKHDCVAGNAA